MCIRDRYQRRVHGERKLIFKFRSAIPCKRKIKKKKRSKDTQQMGKLHGSLARAGKVRKQTPKVAKQERLRKIVKGRALKRILYNKRFSNIVVGAKKKSPNWNAGRKDLAEAEAAKQKRQTA
eukprot:TRINITY_DN1159_c0_g1_i13.p4 TRINITY_DN1159_c0_g1~~TRINITY_DN1159_c0_g1_i13.p4  ORF type:complete len:122 (-),score=40.83 TRINITY_DN1159_c0_g1_i13:223-588(-)